MKMEATTTASEAMVLDTGGAMIPTTVVQGELGAVNHTMQVPSQRLHSSSFVSAAMSPSVMSVSGDYTAPDQPRLQALLQSSGGVSQTKARPKPQTVRNLLPPNTTAPQTLQQTIIIKPPPQIVHTIDAQGRLVEQAGFVSQHQALQAMQAVQDGQNYLIHSLPVLQQAPPPPAPAPAPIVPAPRNASRVEPLSHTLVMTTQSLEQPRSVIVESHNAPQPAPRDVEPATATDPLSVLSDTAARKQPLPVPLPEPPAAAPPTPQTPAPPAGPPASQLHVIQPASAAHEAMDTAQPADAPGHDEKDWDPFADLKNQCSWKLLLLEQKHLVDQDVIGKLRIIKGKR